MDPNVSDEEKMFDDNVTRSDDLTVDDVFLSDEETNSKFRKLQSCKRGGNPWKHDVWGSMKIRPVDRHGYLLYEKMQKCEKDPKLRQEVLWFQHRKLWSQNHWRITFFGSSSKLSTNK